MCLVVILPVILFGLLIMLLVEFLGVAFAVIGAILILLLIAGGIARLAGIRKSKKRARS